MKANVLWFILMTAAVVLGIAWAGEREQPGLPERSTNEMENVGNLQKATFAGGCFWCTEAVFQELKGVYKVTSGYIGGHVANPTYKQVCSGQTGHAEATEILFNPEEISFEELLEVHFKTHDPTTLNRQGADVGTQYRSGIFYHNDQQKAAAESIIAELTRAGVYANPIVTEVTPASQWYPAEDYHQDYYSQNPNQGYCAMVITPKIEKFRKVFADRLRQSGGRSTQPTNPQK
jgi:peptide-methionine (S)-S-oxide reductase